MQTSITVLSIPSMQCAMCFSAISGTISEDRKLITLGHVEKDVSCALRDQFVVVKIEDFYETIVSDTIPEEEGKENVNEGQ